jgi:hypothetical protein
LSHSPPSKDKAELRLPRREPRFSAPFFQILIKAEVCFPDNRYSGHLWDVSREGACIRSFKLIPTGYPSMIRIYDPCDHDFIETQGELVWNNHLRGAHYVGLHFHEDFDITKTFLRLLLKAEAS